MQESFTHKTFEELTKKELYDLMQLRQEIFIVEQDCPYLDADGLDLDATHLFFYKSGHMIAYTRILPPGLVYDDMSAIGRVVIASSSRGKGIGRTLMEESMIVCKRLYPTKNIKISAQEHLKAFYNSLGFNQSGVPYLEDGIPHIAMIYDNEL
ncbi:MAG: GNAT family N-acetyltransferase [Bacteroidia bacterium]|nr:GNAT family N-acetyltransferase [Bacteroidia bacterium]